MKKKTRKDIDASKPIRELDIASILLKLGLVLWEGLVIGGIIVAQIISYNKIISEPKSCAKVWWNEEEIYVRALMSSEYEIQILTNSEKTETRSYYLTANEVIIIKADENQRFTNVEVRCYDDEFWGIVMVGVMILFVGAGLGRLGIYIFDYLYFG